MIPECSSEEFQALEISECEIHSRLDKFYLCFPHRDNIVLVHTCCSEEDFNIAIPERNTTNDHVVYMNRVNQENRVDPHTL